MNGISISNTYKKEDDTHTQSWTTWTSSSNESLDQKHSQVHYIFGITLRYQQYTLQECPLIIFIITVMIAHCIQGIRRLALPILDSSENNPIISLLPDFINLQLTRKASI